MKCPTFAASKVDSLTKSFNVARMADSPHAKSLYKRIFWDLELLCDHKYKDTVAVRN